MQTIARRPTERKRPTAGLANRMLPCRIARRRPPPEASPSQFQFSCSIVLDCFLFLLLLPFAFAFFVFVFFFVSCSLSLFFFSLALLCACAHRTFFPCHAENRGKPTPGVHSGQMTTLTLCENGKVRSLILVHARYLWAGWYVPR